jgi:Ca-activated chloride channel homolog
MINIIGNFDPAVLPTSTGLNTQIPIRLRSDLPESPHRNLNLSLAIDLVPWQVRLYIMPRKRLNRS